MSVNLMFLGCLIKRDKIAGELGAGLAGVGSHALLPQCCSFRLSRASCFCPPPPRLGTIALGSDACSAGQSLPCLPHLCDQNLRVGVWVVGQRGS